MQAITGFSANSGRFRFAHSFFYLLVFQIVCFFNIAQSQYQPNSRTLTLREVTQQSQASTQTQSVKPHPAVVRVIAPHGPNTSYGSGTLIAKKPNYGFIITNWHVVSDTNGYVKVRFPDKKEYNAAVVAVDDRWDLALLVIPEPKDVTPVIISSTIPRIGDNYWVAGYRGDGVYRIKGGRCLAFQSPEPDSVVEPELIDIGVPVEGGDSGGPVFNSRSELAGVLFGSDSVTTVASHCGRVIKFLKQAAPHIASLPANPELVINAASLTQESILDRGAKQLGNVPTHETISVIVQPNIPQSSVSSSSSSFGGSDLRLRENTQTAQTKSFTQRRRHGFINLQYDTTHTAARSTTGGYYASNTGVSSNSLNGSSTSLAANTSDATTNSYSRYGSIINSGTTNSDTTLGGTTSYSPSRQSVASNSTPSDSMATGYGTSGMASNYETIPSATSSPNRVAAIPVSTAQVTSSSNDTSYNNQTGSRAAAASPAYSQNTATRTNPQTLAGGRNDAATFRQQQNTTPGQDTTPGGLRNTSENFYGDTRYGSETSVPTTYNSYSNNSKPSSTTPYASNSSTTTHNGSNDDLHSQYSLNSSDMQADDYAPKYADEYMDYGDSYGTTADDPSTVTGGTKFDAIKIILAILVIFTILFYTIKAMAIAEERT